MYTDMVPALTPDRIWMRGLFAADTEHRTRWSTAGSWKYVDVVMVRLPFAMIHAP
jgi:hypothetical protein